MNKKLIVTLTGIAICGVALAGPRQIDVGTVDRHHHHRHHWCPPPHDPSGRCRGGLRPVDMPPPPPCHHHGWAPPPPPPPPRRCGW